ncbi:hypothetical protein J3Q64DRAFT_1658594, partial [Phycomyces blakesleeanus]
MVYKLVLSCTGAFSMVEFAASPIFKHFLGTEYAILDTHPTDSWEEYPRMSHNIQWMDTSDGFHTTTSTMPIWCRYCHADNHDRQSCPKRPANKRQCWICDQTGHVRDQCPQAQAKNSRPRKESHLTNNTIPEVEMTEAPLHNTIKAIQALLNSMLRILILPYKRLWPS